MCRCRRGWLLSFKKWSFCYDSWIRSDTIKVNSRDIKSFDWTSERTKSSCSHRSSSGGVLTAVHGVLLLLLLPSIYCPLHLLHKFCFQPLQRNEISERLLYNSCWLCHFWSVSLNLTTHVTYLKHHVVNFFTRLLWLCYLGKGRSNDGGMAGWWQGGWWCRCLDLQGGSTS